MNVYIRKDTSYYFPIIYILKVIEKNREIKFDFLDNPDFSNSSTLREKSQDDKDIWLAIWN